MNPPVQTLILVFTPNIKIWLPMWGNQLAILPPGGSIGPRYVPQLLFSEKSQIDQYLSNH
jgi:hypothetical protein